MPSFRFNKMDILLRAAFVAFSVLHKSVAWRTRSMIIFCGLRRVVKQAEGVCFSFLVFYSPIYQLHYLYPNDQWCVRHVEKKTFQCLLFIPFNLKQNSHFLFERSCNFACIFSSVHGLTDMIGWCRVRLNRFGVKLCLFMFCTWISLAHFNQNVHASPAAIGVFCFSNPCLIS